MAKLIDNIELKATTIPLTPQYCVREIITKEMSRLLLQAHERLLRLEILNKQLMYKNQSIRLESSRLPNVLVR